MQLSKYCSPSLNILYNFKNKLQPLEIYHATQEGLYFLGTQIVLAKTKQCQVPPNEINVIKPEILFA